MCSLRYTTLMSNEPKANKPTENIVSKVVWVLLMGALTMAASSFASKHYVEQQIDQKLTGTNQRVSTIENGISTINVSLKGIKKDTCYTRASLAKLLGESSVNCLEQSD